MTGIEEAARAAAAVGKAVGPGEVQKAKEIVAQHIVVDPDALAEVLRSTYGDAGIRATREAARHLEQGGYQLSASLSGFVSGYDWDSWKPGSPGIAATQLPGIRRRLDEAKTIAAGISNTTRDRIAQTIAEGIATGASYSDVTRSIRAITGDAFRADVIAITETNRAYNYASLDTYRQSGISGWIWVAYSEACDQCLAKGGQAFGYQDPIPPAHPDCRCGVVADFKGWRYTGASKPSSTPLPSAPSVPRAVIPAPAVAPTVTPAPAETGSPFEPMAGTQVKFKSFADVRRHFEARGVKVSSNVDNAKKRYNIGLDFFEEVVGGIEDAEAKFGGVWETLKGGKFEMPELSDGTLAYIRYRPFRPAVSNDFGIAANRLGRLWGLGGRAKLEEVMATSSTASRTLRDTVYHEMQHVWQHNNDDFYNARVNTTPKWRPGVNVFGNPIDTPKVIEAMREAGYIDSNYEWDLDAIRADISNYATDKAVEFDAELSNILSTPARFEALSDEGKRRVIAYRDAANRLMGRTVVKAEDSGESESTSCTFGDLGELIDEAIRSLR